MYQKIFIIVGTVLAIAFSFFFMRNWDSWQINSFEDCVAAGNPVMESYPRQCRTTDGRHFTEEIDQPIGGERDARGCLGPAGYSYSEEVGACIREWEIVANQREAARIAVDYVGWKYATTILEVQTARCPGCFIVKMELGEDNKERRTFTLENYTVTRMSMIPEECDNMNGTVVTTTGGIGCNETQDNLGDVTGFISPAICCK